MLKLICFILLGFGCVVSTFLTPEAGESFFGNLIKSLAPLGAPLAPAANPNIGLPPAHGVGVGVGASGIPPSNTIGRGGCPLCDSSVYSYCSAKMVHDACCCSGGVGLPFNCQAMDCSFLNANSCQEHALIFMCCCNNPYHK